ncbi:MAG: hypothetical protein PUA62_00840 [Lachnospiraceae bacterium]|nr:hypothetical protein [Lachnospiraceae bacterium]
MVCKQCGKEILEGKSFCDECLLTLEQENEVVVLSKETIKKNMKKASRNKAVVDLTGYVKALTNERLRIVMLVGAILTYLSPFLSWMKSDFNYINEMGKKHSASLFEIGGDTAVLSLSQRVITWSAILLMIAGFMMLVRSAKDHIPVMQTLLDIRWSAYVPCGVVAVALLWFFINKGVRNAWKTVIKPDIGILVCLVGIVLYVIANVLYDKKEKEK